MHSALNGSAVSESYIYSKDAEDRLRASQSEGFKSLEKAINRLELKFESSLKEFKDDTEKAIDRLENNQKSMKTDISALKFSFFTLIILMLAGVPDIKTIASFLLKLQKI